MQVMLLKGSLKKLHFLVTSKNWQKWKQPALSGEPIPYKVEHQEKLRFIAVPDVKSGTW